MSQLPVLMAVQMQAPRHEPVVPEDLKHWADNLGLQDEAHARRVMHLTLNLNERLRWARPAVALQAGYLHDIGKTLISTEVLGKPSALSAAERRLIERHSEYGAALAQTFQGILPDVPAAIRHHHELYDGEGYPEALTGEQIPALARILAVADVYDALTSLRTYRAAWNHEETMRYMETPGGQRFDPLVLRALTSLMSPSSPAP